MSQYQNFGSGGASNSAAKLEALRLPADMAGMRFLDIGCNAGFFCIEAAKRGATCVGIEADATWHAEAGANALSFGYNHECEFILGRWGDVLPTLEERFDIILWASAIHYEQNQRAVMRL
ncbi:MAG: methyltransferase domain-containing protein, partial [Dehalococcoidia bacterium]|nr:methyltransferase domain-containing protein [Dehalococcoidia bacterium]